MASAATEEDRQECKLLQEQWVFLQKSIEKERAELNRILTTLSNSQLKPKVAFNMDQFIWRKVDAAFEKYDKNKDGVLSGPEA